MIPQNCVQIMKNDHDQFKVAGVYVLENVLNGKIYVGSSKNIARRIYEHFKDLKGGRHHSIHLQRAWNLYGETSFKTWCLEMVELDYTNFVPKRILEDHVWTKQQLSDTWVSSAEPVI